MSIINLFNGNKWFPFYTKEINRKPDAVSALSSKDGALAYTGVKKTEGCVYGANTPPSSSSRLNYDGHFYATRVYNAVYNDYAEYFEKGEEMSPGDVVVLKKEGEEKYIKSSHPYDPLCIGVVSDEYGQCLGGKGDGKDEENYIPIGLAGRVRVKTTGPIKKGDLLTTSSVPGHAMAIKEYLPGTVIGKALESKDSEDSKRIRMLIMNL